MLAICIGTDLVPAVAIAYERPELDVMKRMPRNAKTDHLLTHQLLWFAYMQIGIIESLAGFMCYFTIMYDYGFKPNTLWFLHFDNSGTKPANSDIYDKYLHHKGNSHVGQSDYDGALVDWLTDLDGKRDLRVWFWKKSDDSWSDCRYPGMKSPITNHQICYTSEALHYAQYGWFIGILITQISNAFIVKTRRVSIKDQGFGNMAINYAILFEIIIGLVIGYAPKLNDGMGGRPLPFLQWGFPAVPFFIFMVCYDEIRKWGIRKMREIRPHEISWLEKNTFY